ncbi:hypothetical protein G7Z17_g6821 [Cylindrodendrum hubeiense]|uniref:Carnosine N-methyltransferase n=1 Tax=Cylindrodendrum hubeiense TaxID=595255 RepID=A0A9P5H9H4_9HYPO|nr:hypothetical protein G7Z17_g6821 [Cylindrodendrum hubeiense]
MVAVRLTAPGLGGRGGLTEGGGEEAQEGDGKGGGLHLELVAREEDVTTSDRRAELKMQDGMQERDLQRRGILGVAIRVLASVPPTDDDAPLPCWATRERWWGEDFCAAAGKASEMTRTSHLSAMFSLFVFALLLAISWAAGEADNIQVPSHEHELDLASMALNGEDLTDPLNSMVEVHEVIVTLQQISGAPNTPRHLQEKSKLLNAFARPKGELKSNHPRHRLLDALHGFTRYQERQKTELDRLKGLYKHVSKAQKSLLEHQVKYSKKFNRINHILSQDQVLCDRIVQNALEFYGIGNEELQKHIKDTESAGRKADKIAVSQSLKHIVRDWTEPGAHERDGPFLCLLKTLQQMFPNRDNAAPIKALLPGAGLGRLGYDIADLGGFEVTLNEWSMYMNVAYRFMEAHRARHSESFHPFIDGWSHHATEADMHRKLSFPDVEINASSVVMVEGDFNTAFQNQAGYYDVVITYFFIDTARNLMSYFDTIKKVLKPGGHWINLGPLLYGTGPFVQLSLEEIVLVTEAMGFQYLDTDESCGDLTFPSRKVRGIEAIYGFDDRALTKNAYNAQFWVARRSEKA